MVPLKPIDLYYAQHQRLRYVAEVPPGTTIADITDPGYWVHHIPKLKPGTLIEVLSEDNVLDAEVRVLEVGPTFAKVRVIRNYEAPPSVIKEDRPLPDDIRVDYAGKVEKWRVTHKDKVVKSGHGSREEAEKTAEDYRNKFAA